jgi:hypothetical protein
MRFYEFKGSVIILMISQHLDASEGESVSECLQAPKLEAVDVSGALQRG